MGRLKNKMGIITGGASGIGKATAIHLSGEGARVVIFDKNRAAAYQVADEIVAKGGEAVFYEVDVTSYEQLERAIDEVCCSGELWFMVHAAGWDSPAPFLTTHPAEWAKVIDINLVGALNMHHLVCKKMRDSGGGRIVSIASDSARVGAGNCALYSAAKNGIIAFTKSLARELASENILLNTLCPGPTDTPLLNNFSGSSEDAEKLMRSLIRNIPLGRIAQAEDYNEIITLLISAGGDYITGQTISVSGGLTML